MLSVSLSANLLLVCLLQSYHKRYMGVYKVFNSSDLMLLFYKDYFCFILDQRRTNSKHNCVYFKLLQFFIRYRQFHF